MTWCAATLGGTPSRVRFRAGRALRIGVEVLIEKPLAPGMDGVERFAAACRAADVVVAVGFNRRFWRPVNDLVHALAQSSRSPARGRVLLRPGCRVRQPVSLGAYRIDLRSDRCRPGRGMVRLALDGLDAVGRRTRGRPLSILESHDLQLADFADCVMNRRMPRASLADGIAAVRCIAAARRSAALGGLRVEP